MRYTGLVRCLLEERVVGVQLDSDVYLQAVVMVRVSFPSVEEVLVRTATPLTSEPPPNLQHQPSYPVRSPLILFYS